MTEEALNKAEERRRQLEELKVAVREVSTIEEGIGVSLDSLVNRLKNKKQELTDWRTFLEAYDAKVDELDKIESEILLLLKKKLETQ